MINFGLRLIWLILNLALLDKTIWNLKINEKHGKNILGLFKKWKYLALVKIINYNHEFLQEK